VFSRLEPRHEDVTRTTRLNNCIQLDLVFLPFLDFKETRLKTKFKIHEPQMIITETGLRFLEKYDKYLTRIILMEPVELRFNYNSSIVGYYDT